MSVNAEIDVKTLQEFIVGLSTVTDVAKVNFTKEGCFGIVRDSKKAMKVHTALKVDAFKQYIISDCSMLFLVEDIQTIINIATHFSIKDIGFEYDGKDVIDFNLGGVHKKVLCADKRYDENIGWKPKKKWDVEAKIDAKSFELFLRGAILVSEVAAFSATAKGMAFVTHDPNASVNLVLKKEDTAKLKKLTVNNKAQSFYAVDYLVVGSVPICRTTPIMLNFDNGGQLLLSSRFAKGNGIVECWLAPKSASQTVDEEAVETPEQPPQEPPPK